MTPPLVWRGLAAVKHAINPPPPPPEEVFGYIGDFASWHDAESQCGLGYQDPAAVQYAVESTKQLASWGTYLDGAHMFLLAALLHCRPKSVLDFGGATGGHYHLLRRFLPPIRWTVVDLPATIHAARGSETEELHFATELVQADLVLASGVLQVCRDPYATLAELVALRPRHVVVARLPLMERERLTIHRVPPHLFRASFPC